MPPKKEKRANYPPQKAKILQFFKPIPPKTEAKDTKTSVSDKPPTTIARTENEQPAPQPEPAEAQSFHSLPEVTSSQRIIRDSDDEGNDSSDSDLDLPVRSPPHATPIAIANRENGQPSLQSEPAEAQPFSSEPRMTSQLAIEDSDQESDLSGIDSDLSEPLPAHAVSHEPSPRITPTRGIPAAARTTRSRAAPYLKRTPKPRTKDAESSLSDTPPTTTTKSKNERSPRKPEPADAQAASIKAEMTTGQQIFGDSDGSSDSDSDLPDLFTAPTASHKPTSKSSRKLRDTGSTTKSNAPPYSSPLTFQPKHKYKFSIASLVSQSQRHEATEASAQRAKSILDEPENEKEAEQQGDKEALLDLVIADKDASSADKILRAVARTEATATEKRWYFFDPDSGTPTHKPTEIPANIPQIYQKWNLGRMIDRDSTAVSGIMRNVVSSQEELSDKHFLWILEMSCIQPAATLEEQYFDVLLAAPDAIYQCLRPKIVKGMFDLLGARPQATDRKANVEAVGVYREAYKGRDWGALQRYIQFLGDAAKFVTPATCGYAMSLLARLCADVLVKDTSTVLSTVLYTTRELCVAIEENDEWEISVCAFFASFTHLLTELDSAGKYAPIYINQ